jgi:hypothetical protein
VVAFSTKLIAKVRRKKEEGRRKKEEIRRKKEEGRRKKEALSDNQIFASST